jgi:hypothetical protein
LYVVTDAIRKIALIRWSSQGTGVLMQRGITEYNVWRRAR